MKALEWFQRKRLLNKLINKRVEWEIRKHTLWIGGAYAGDASYLFLYVESPIL